MKQRPWHQAVRRSMRLRLLTATIAALVLALLLAGVAIDRLFREHVTRQFERGLAQQLDQVTARLEVDAAGQPTIDPRTLSDPRWHKPYSGLYWQLDRIAEGGTTRRGVLRSRSLWDSELSLAVDALAPGAAHLHEGTGPRNAKLLMLERTVTLEDLPATRWRLIVAADADETAQAVQHFTGVLVASLAALGTLLVLAGLAQMRVGLAPLRDLQRALAGLRVGSAARLKGSFPDELQPLVEDFNSVLDRNAELVGRARTQAGNLAHALKTPLAVMRQAAARTSPDQPPAALAQLVGEQVDAMQRQIDWHLARARAAAAQGMPGTRTPVASAVADLAHVMRHVHHAHDLHLDIPDIAPSLAFAGEEQDLQEMLGNLLDNACKWARSTVRVDAARLPRSASAQRGEMFITIDDDGPGIEDAARDAVLARGVRADENVPGSGLGLAIVDELARLYGGSLRLERSSALGGLRAILTLPLAG